MSSYNTFDSARAPARGSTEEDPNQPLLSTSNDAALHQVQPSRTPLPKRQLFILFFMRLSEHTSFNVIYPFVNEMVQRAGKIGDPKAVGYYSGLLESLFNIAQFLTVFWWGYISDRLGRKPVILLELLGIAIFMTAFGFSTSLLQMIIFRTIAGALNGNIAVIKCVIGEITDETNQSRAFAIIPMAASTGFTLAPFLGGVLSRPADRFPSVFGNWQIFVRHPYALPCITATTITLLALIAGAVFFKETLENPKRWRWVPDSESKPQAGATISVPAPSTSTSTSGPLLLEVAPTAAPMSIRKISQDPVVRSVMIPYLFLGLANVSFESIFVLWMYTPLHSGGMGFLPATIGTTLSVSGLASLLVSAWIFPTLQRRFGTLPLYHIAMSAFPIMALCYPIVQKAAEIEGRRAAVIGLSVITALRCIAGASFACNMILVNASAPERRSLGSVNGLAQMVTTSMRAVGPGLASSIFALSLQKGYLGGQLIWVYLFGIGLAAAGTSFWAQDGRQGSRCT